MVTGCLILDRQILCGYYLIFPNKHMFNPDMFVVACKVACNVTTECLCTSCVVTHRYGVIIIGNAKVLSKVSSIRSSSM